MIRRATIEVPLGGEMLNVKLTLKPVPLRWLRIAGGYTTRRDNAVTTDGRVLRNIAPMVDATFGTLRARVMPVDFDPVRDDPRMQMPEPGEPVDGVHGDGGRDE